MSISSLCDDDQLELFSREHYTFINQIFGDLTVRGYIRSIWKRNAKKFTFEVIEVPPEGEFDTGSDHHMLGVYDKKRKKIGTWCSVDGCEIPGEECELGYQDLRRDKRDTLCQSYTLLKYLGYELPLGTTPAARKQLQMNMVAMYRKIITNRKFI